MLIDSVKAIDDGKITSLPSIVWFGTIDRVYSVLPQALYFSRSAGFELRGATVGREINVAIANGSGIVDKPQLLSQVVQGAPEILQNISGDCSNGIRYFFDSKKIIDQATRLRVALGPDFIRVGVEEDPDLSLEIDDVLFGPFNFYLNERKPFISSHDL
jgi:hypothetical protein